MTKIYTCTRLPPVRAQTHLIFFYHVLPPTPHPLPKRRKVFNDSLEIKVKLITKFYLKKIVYKLLRSIIFDANIFTFSFQVNSLIVTAVPLNMYKIVNINYSPGH